MNNWSTTSQVNIKGLTEQKNGFTYLSWAQAWRLLKENHPKAKVTKHNFTQPDGTVLPHMMFDGGAFVQVSVDLGGGDVTTEVYPVTDYKNMAILKPKSTDINNAHQRAMAKCIAMATGISLHLFYGEDMPRQSVEAVGVDNSAQQAASGSVPATAEAFKSSASTNPVVPTEAGTQKPESVLAKQSLHKLIEVAPTMDALIDLFKAHQDKLDEFDKSLFTARKKELNFNG